MGVVHKHLGQQGANDWSGVEKQPYSKGGAVGGSVRVVIGPEDGANNFSVRYFEIEPGGQSSFDRHPHDHGIYILRGRAKVLIGWDVHDVGPGDVVYIAPDEQHQFESVGEEPLGFLCVVPPKEDLPKPVAVDPLTPKDDLPKPVAVDPLTPKGNPEKPEEG